MKTKEYICVIDLEATCDKRSKCVSEYEEYDHEIIEIGALLCDLDGNKVYSTFNEFVKPVRNPELTQYCKSLTTIKQEQVDLADGFIKVMKNFNEWLFLYSKENIDGILFASWGAWDKRQLTKDCVYHQIPYPFCSQHLNIKQLFLDKMDRQRAGVKKALRILGMEFQGVPHRALEDTKNIFRIYKDIIKI